MLSKVNKWRHTNFKSIAILRLWLPLPLSVVICISKVASCDHQSKTFKGGLCKIHLAQCSCFHGFPDCLHLIVESTSGGSANKVKQLCIQLRDICVQQDLMTIPNLILQMRKKMDWKWGGSVGILRVGIIIVCFLVAPLFCFFLY